MRRTCTVRACREGSKSRDRERWGITPAETGPVFMESGEGKLYKAWGDHSEPGPLGGECPLVLNGWELLMDTGVIIKSEGGNLKRNKTEESHTWQEKFVL